MTPLCVVCGSVCPDLGLWVVRGGEACSQGCARRRAEAMFRETVNVRRMVEMVDDHDPGCCHIVWCHDSLAAS